MMNKKLIAAFLTAIMSLPLFTGAASAALVVGVSGIPSDEPFVQPLSIPANNTDSNILARSNFDSADCIEMWTPLSSNMNIEWYADENGGYIRTDKIVDNYHGFMLKPETEIGVGIYKFTGYFRTFNRGEKANLRIEFVDLKSKTMGLIRVNCTNEWQKVEYYVTLNNTLQHIYVRGGDYPEFIQDYCMDEFSLVRVDSIPEGANATDTFGEEFDREENLELTYANMEYSPTYDPEEYLAKYTVNGIMMNNDASSTISGIGRSPYSVTKETLRTAILQYKDTHVTDFMITLCDEISTYPSEVWTSQLEKYYQTEENGVAVDYTNNELAIGARHVWETLNTDYVALWAETLAENGINPWLCFRMNDVHDRSLETSVLLSDFYHENPELRRVTHPSYATMRYAYNYTHKKVRDHYLAFINEALNRYDVYGIELEFQREIFLWHLGGEYNGLDILNDFMRELDDLLKVYEQKYGHELKLAVCVAPDPMTNYELGLDIVTWAAEGIIDHVTPIGRFECSEFDIPIKLWKSMLSPYGVTVAAGIDASYVRHSMASENAGWNLELYAGFCANAYSQGADKIYVRNMNTSAKLKFAEKDKTTIGSDSSAATDGLWAFITNMGSYDKVIEMNRRCTPTFNDTIPAWKRLYNAALPVSVGKNTTATVKIPVGDITVGSAVYLEFSAQDSYLDRIDNFKVYVNSEPCEFVGIYSARPGGRGDFTKNRVARWSVPTEAQEDIYMIVEVMYDGDGGCSIDHMEIYVEPNLAS